MIRFAQCFVALFCLLSQAVFAEIVKVNFLYVGPTEGSVWLGVQQGLKEANIQGQFLGQEYSLQAVTVDKLKPTGSETAVIVALPTDEILAIANMAELASVPVFNLTSDADALRTACLPNLLNIPPSQRMKNDAVAQWHVKHPDTEVTGQGWHADFHKFAARELNSRFKKANVVAMDDDSWSGWASIKMLSDSVARSQVTAPDKMLVYLKNEMEFDGQKGVGTTFRDTGQLRQLVLLVENGKLVAEAPVRGSKGGLDGLGLPSCK